VIDTAPLPGPVPSQIPSFLPCLILIATGKLQNVNPDPHTFETVVGDTSSGTQQTKMLEFFARTILSGEYLEPKAGYWGDIALATQSILDAIFISMKNNGAETPVVRHQYR
jgi:hypothetical protein